MDWLSSSADVVPRSAKISFCTRVDIIGTQVSNSNSATPGLSLKTFIDTRWSLPMLFSDASQLSASFLSHLRSNLSLPFSSIQLQQQILTYTQLFTTPASKASFPEPWLDIRWKEPYFWVSAFINPQYRSDAITQDQFVHRLAFQPSIYLAPVEECPIQIS